MMKTQAIIVAAGRGIRLKKNQPKALIVLGKKPMVALTLQCFERCPSVDSLILVGPPDHLDHFRKLVKTFRIKKVAKIVPGGKTRCQSVSNGLKALDSDSEIVLIHDGARPFVSNKVIQETIRVAQKQGAAIAAVPVKSTIKEADSSTMIVQETLDRSKLWEVQTPQAFKRDIILKAHRYNIDEDVTDDAALVERMGVGVRIVVGDYHNMKVTTPEDLVLAEALMKNNKKR